MLDLLAIDLPNQVACHSCKKLHNMENLQRYNSSTYSSGSMIRHLYADLPFPLCVSQDRKLDTFFISHEFGTTACKMAIKRHHNQPECTELLDMMSSKVARIRVDGHWVRQSREECRVIRGNLMHRRQIAYTSRKPSPNTLLTDDPPREMICLHINFARSLGKIGCDVMQCQKCRTEYRIDCKNYPGFGLVIFLTKWKDLGSGPETDVWKRHLLPKPEASLREAFFSRRLGATGRFQTQAEDHPQVGDISSAFEDSEHFEFDSLLTPENKVDLFLA